MTGVTGASAEAWLMLLALALYLYGSLQLLRPNEAVMVRGARGRWHAGFGAHRWKLAAKEPYLPNPLTPHRPLLRLAWAFECEAPARTALPMQVPAQIEGLRGSVWVSGVCLFVLLPIGLFLRPGLAFTLGAIALLYLNNTFALVRVWRWRRPLGLSSRQYAVTAFECLVCPPFSVNLVRTLCAHVAVNESFTSAAHRCLAADELAAAHAQCLLRLEEHIECTPEDSPRMPALLASRARFAPLTLSSSP